MTELLAYALSASTTIWRAGTAAASVLTISAAISVFFEKRAAFLLAELLGAVEPPEHGQREVLLAERNVYDDREHDPHVAPVPDDLRPRRQQLVAVHRGGPDVLAGVVPERVVHRRHDDLVLGNELLEDETDELEADLIDGPDRHAEKPVEARVMLVARADGTGGAEHTGHRVGLPKHTTHPATRCWKVSNDGAVKQSANATTNGTKDGARKGSGTVSSSESHAYTTRVLIEDDRAVYYLRALFRARRAREKVLKSRLV